MRARNILRFPALPMRATLLAGARRKRHGRIRKPGLFLTCPEFCHVSTVGPRPDRSDTIVTLLGGSCHRVNSAAAQCGTRSVRSWPDRRAPMRLQHLDLVTSDVTALAAFFQRFFRLRPMPRAAKPSSSCATRRFHPDRDPRKTGETANIPPISISATTTRPPRWKPSTPS